MDPITKEIPIITITADQVNPLGITLNADQIAPLGITLGDQPAASAGPQPAGTITIPFLDLPHFDERSGCGLAHEYLNAHGYADGLPTADAADLPAYRTCPSYHNGLCGGNGWHDACLFCEPATSAGWACVRRWRLLPSSSICYTESYAEMLADELAWPAAKPLADQVAASFGIAADERGTVRDDRLIMTTGADLSLGLAWCLALVGCAESEIPDILATWVPAAIANPDAQVEVSASNVYGALSSAALHGVRLGR